MENSNGANTRINQSNSFDYNFRAIFVVDYLMTMFMLFDLKAFGEYSKIIYFTLTTINNIVIFMNLILKAIDIFERIETLFTITERMAFAQNQSIFLFFSVYKLTTLHLFHGFGEYVTKRFACSDGRDDAATT